MENSPGEEKTAVSTAKIQTKDKTLTARILSTAVSKKSWFQHIFRILINFKFQDISAMMSGAQKGLPIKVPTVPIKVVTSNTTQVNLTKFLIKL